MVVQPRIVITGLESPSFAAHSNVAGDVVLAGVVPTAEIATAIVAGAAAAYGADHVVDEIAVDTRVGATFSLHRFATALQLFAPFGSWRVVIEGDAISAKLRGGAAFATGSSRLTPELMALLDISAGILIRNPSLSMTIEGHTDSVGSERSNERLSVARAEAAFAYLVEVGVAPERLTSAGCGEASPIADNETTEGRAKNRRVEFLLGPETGGR